jgi:hypothetical protein
MRGAALHGLETGFWEIMTKVPDRLSGLGSDLKLWLANPNKTCHLDAGLQ